ncbi:phage tail protein [Sphingomonas sp. HT-1]|jgi:microcystin-dependent protein|uniref:phage tail protein n=1 Tax=unclassified Sphingomonas TaxID=196159 RepID=UPI000314D4D4|nr:MULTISPECIES: tail fiber protein [unclassified Sphingomonas]KTF70638.1 phage tail protein [Sphingomonas sp. WG]
MDPFIGQIMQVGFRYAPVNWLLCNGTVMQVNQNQALFALLGNTFGGNGQTTFALPDARGRVFLGTGSGPGLTPRNPGANGGLEQASLSVQQLPVHNHTATFSQTTSAAFSGQLTALSGLDNATEVAAPENGAFLGTISDPDTSPKFYVPASHANDPGVTAVNLAGVSGQVGSISGGVVVNNAGASAPVSMMQPFLAVTTIIAAVGVWPEQP